MTSLREGSTIERSGRLGCGSVLILVVVALSLLPTASAARQPAPAPQSQAAPSERSPFAAALLQAAFPPLPLGYLYAGNVWRGLIPTGVMVAGATLFFVEAVEIFDWTDPDASDELILLGLAATAGGYVFGIIDAANVAKNRNAQIRAQGAALFLAPAAQGVRIGVTIPVG
jgi:hypothetical protein